MLWLAIRGTDFTSIGESLVAADSIWAAPFLPTLFAFYWLKSARWRDLLSPSVDARTRDLFPSVMIGYAGTAILPLQMGELVRTFVASKKFTLPFSLVLSSVAIERIFDLLTILGLLGIALATVQSTPEILIKAGYVIATVTLAGLLMAIWLVMKTEVALSVARSSMRWLPEPLSNVILKHLEAIAHGCASIRSPRLLIRVAANSILQWGLMGLCIWFSLLAIDIHVPVPGVILVLVATIVGVSLPASPGYLGSIQLAFVVALRPFGIDAAQAVAASVFYHVLAYVAVVVVGFTYAHRLGYGILEIEAEARASTSKQG